MSTYQGNDSQPSHIVADILIVGGGFGGCYALHQMRALGYTVKLLEAGSDFGGVWHFNKYPGARVDSETPLYQLSLHNAWRSFNFQERFPGHMEIRNYFAHLAEALDLRKDAVFNARVVESTFSADSNTWTLRTNNGLTATSRYVVFATGTTNKPYIPAFPGIHEFAGTVIHPAAWPTELDVTGKTIGVVGQGASGLQIVQELGKKPCNLTVFVRNPPTALPMRQRSLGHDESEHMKTSYDALFFHAKYRHESGYSYSSFEDSFNDATPEERRQRYEELWERGTYGILTSNYPEHTYDRVANSELYQFWAEKTRERISDPRKRDIMAPLEQFQWIGAKRPNLEMDYYEIIDQSNVELVDLKTSPIKEFVRDGVVTSDNHFHPLDIVVVATGYDSVTGSLYEMNVTDSRGETLQQKWKEGISTYLGMLIPDVPNAFLLYGPQAPSGLTNGPPFLELQVEWLVKFLNKIELEGVVTVKPSHDAAKDYKRKNMEIYNKSFLSETPSWWNGSNIPGTNQEPLFWVGGLQAWRLESLKALQDWSHFDITRD
ncbi:Baeyer-Villiger monooxygenase [Colletotrichum siamense]|uniref:Baeyer-Villiger monooxygenase n=1 Tax=Colletotrichum siamense TaxID=690259 RepID=A0A9P5K776_COLSI|nr:Baeyer-Villiger monooxygenase [Colletotrichum siamense]KAF4860706.1 Baeyer-Villiger monooxygenase [Colletotrichum siamense]